MGLQCLYRETKASVKILRCFGERSRLALPEYINGKKVTELGDYIFSGDMREKPEGTMWEEDSGETGGKAAEESILTESCGPELREICLPALRRFWQSLTSL